MPSLRDWLSEEEAADWLDLPLEVIRAAVASGDLPSLRLGGYTRIHRESLIALAGGTSPRVSGSTAREPEMAGRRPPTETVTWPGAPVTWPGDTPIRRGEPAMTPTDPTAPTRPAPPQRGLAMPYGVEWIEDLAPADPFVQVWPQTGGGRLEEPYPEAHAGRIAIDRKAIHHRRLLVNPFRESPQSIGTAAANRAPR